MTRYTLKCNGNGPKPAARPLWYSFSVEVRMYVSCRTPKSPRRVAKRSRTLAECFTASPAGRHLPTRFLGSNTLQPAALKQNPYFFFYLIFSSLILLGQNVPCHPDTALTGSPVQIHTTCSLHNRRDLPFVFMSPTGVTFYHQFTA